MTKSTQAQTVQAHLPVFSGFQHGGSQSPFAGSWVRYGLKQPIDWNWEMLSRLDRVWSANREVPHGLAITDPWAAFHLGAFLQVVMNHGCVVASDHREAPRIIALPFDDGFVTHGFVWKVDTNGQTFIVLKQQSAKALMSLIDPDQDSVYEQTLFCFSDGR